MLKKENVIEKRNELNEIMWRDRLTLQALRFLSVYLSRINAREPEKTRKVRFLLKEFAAIMEYAGNFNRTHYESTITRLLGYAVHRRLDSGGLESFQLFRKAVLDIDSNGNWYVEIDAHDDALPLMFNFKKNYFTYELWNVLHLKSTNALRMYEILKQYEIKGERTIALTDLRKLLFIEPAEYPRWERFKVRVLDANQKALAEKTDLKYTYEPIRNGRGGKVTGIKFFIEKNNDYDGQMTFDEFVGYQTDNQIYFEAPTADETDRRAEMPRNDRKNELTRAKQSPMWYYALETAKKLTTQNKGIRATPERYAIGIFKKWSEAGYESEYDLRQSGEIPQNMKKPSFDLDEFESQVTAYE